MKVKKINFIDNSVSHEEIKLNSKLELNDEFISKAIRSTLSSKRKGSAKIKSMSEISGTTAKPHSQKGTGKARQGSKRSVQFRGGRTCFGPVVRSFHKKLSKNVVKKSIISALISKINNSKLLISSDFKLDKPSTKLLSKSLNDNKIKNALFLYKEKNDNVLNLIKSINNIKDIESKNIDYLNIYDILRFDYIIADEKSILQIKEQIN